MEKGAADLAQHQSPHYEEIANSDLEHKHHIEIRRHTRKELGAWRRLNILLNIQMS